MKKTCIVIAGPTAVGKTAVAIELAQHFNTKIISADSRQCYRELNIAVAKPSPAELKLVQHYFINTHSIVDEFSAANYESYALSAIREIFLENDVAILTGGTGLYIKAFCEGLDAIPVTDAAIRNRIIQAYEQNGIEFLRDQLEKEDPLFFSYGEIQNPQRMIRALEVQLSTGKSIRTYQSKQKKQRDFDIIKIGLQLPRDILYERINNRVDQMMEAGLLEEVSALIPYKDRNALQTVGYKELFDYFANNSTLPKAVELIKQHTRHYAKRQMTWFKKDEEISWCAPVTADVMHLIAQMR